jgi:outer membrane protein assembly factor BamB
MPRTLLSLISCLGAATAAAAEAPDSFVASRLENWHQWRGPEGTGVAPRGDPPLRWDEKTNLVWKVEVPGEGHASPIVWKDRIYLLTAVKTARQAESPPAADARRKTTPPNHYYSFQVLAIDRESGKVLWNRTACEELPHEGRHETNTYASASPTTDGRRIYASFGSRGIYCYDLEGGFQWKRDLGDMRTRLGWGEGASPAVHGDTLVVNWDQEEESRIAALDAASGKTRWEFPRDEVTSWATPLVVEHGGKAQVIVNGTKRVRSYDLATGTVIWECGGQTANAIPSPVATGGVVYCVSGYRGAAAHAIPLDARGDVTGTAKVLWSLDRGTPYVPSPILYGDRIYFTQTNNAILSGVDAGTGKVLIDRARLEALDSLYASPVGAGGRIYFAGRNGATVVIRRGDALEILATNQLDDPIDASPAIAGRQIFIRGRKYLYAFEDGAPRGAEPAKASDS